MGKIYQFAICKPTLVHHSYPHFNHNPLLAPHKLPKSLAIKGKLRFATTSTMTFSDFKKAQGVKIFEFDLIWGKMLEVLRTLLPKLGKVNIE